MKPLSERERRFVLAMTGEALGNASEAARIAGYSPQSAPKSGYLLTKRAHVQHAIAARKQKLGSALDIRDERILQELAEVGYTKVEINGQSKMKALELLAKHKGLLNEGDTSAARVTVNIGFLQAPAHNTHQRQVIDMVSTSHQGLSHASPATTRPLLPSRDGED